jgi:sigma-B regulation protein RsbU (phosphoserine phosphatase)
MQINPKMIEAKASLLLEAPCGIFSITENGAISAANPYCCKLLEYHLDQLIGLNISDLLTISGKIFYQTHFYPLVKLHRHTEEIFLNLQTRTKKELPVVLNAVVTETSDGIVIICSFIQVLNRRRYEDEILSAKRKAEEALRQNEALEKVKQELEIHQKELDKKISLLTFQNNELVQLGNVVTHDLQEPARKLILFSGELSKGHFDENKKEYALSVIAKSAQRIKTLLITLQHYLGLTTSTIVHEQINLTDVVQIELKQLQKLFSKVQVHADIAPLPTVTGSRKQLSLLFLNLLKNAFEHGTVDNVLQLHIEAVIVKHNLFHSLQDKYTYVDCVKIDITDKGPGFDNNYKDYIFDVLKKLNLATSSLGFGLACCRKIVENHFGNIKASGSPGAGATFTVTLPLNYFGN